MRLIVSNPHRTSLGWPYAYVLDGSTVVKARFGVTKRHAVWRATRARRRLERKQS